MNANEYNRALIDQLADADDLDPAWRTAFLETPRHLFIPDVIWRKQEEWSLVALNRADDPGAWLSAVYADEPIVTQVDDGATPLTAVGQRISSSSSMPTVVAAMLHHLDVEPGNRVLEIGTGTGWNAGLLAARLGDSNVVSVEVDAHVADQAREALRKAGRAPLLVTGDGSAGHPAGAPYDRVIATAAVRRIPHAWVEQTRPGGLIVAPVGNDFDNGCLVALRVGDDGTASGRVVDPSVAFMWLRGDRGPELTMPGFRARAEQSATKLNPDVFAWDDLHARFAVGALLPDVRNTFVDAEDGSEDFEFWLMSGASWAHVDVLEDADVHPVYQHGPRRLWDEAEAAYGWWVEAGQPEATRFGLTVTPDGQTVWLDEPGSPVA